MKEKYWVIIYRNKIFRNELHNTKSRAKEFVNEYLPRDYKIIKVKLSETK